MNRISTNFLRLAFVLGGLAIAAILGLRLVTPLVRPGYDLYRPLAAGLWLSAVPFYLAVYQAFKLLHLIDRRHAFSSAAVRALARIKYCAVAIAAIYLALLPFLFNIAQADDAPGVFAFGLVFFCAALTVGAFVAVMQALIQNVIDMKSENELTV